MVTAVASDTTNADERRRVTDSDPVVAASDAPSALRTRSLAVPAAQPAPANVLGRYELLAELAAGGMATVYAARLRGEAGLQRLVAVKTLHPHLRAKRALVEMFLDEARLAAAIHHPNVVAVLDSGCDTRGQHFIVMQYVAGEQLGALLRTVAESSKRIAPPVVVRIVLDALEGLCAAHGLSDEQGRSLGLVHRDLSPHNILVGEDGRARITDFGVARAEGRLHVTDTDVVKGKLSYMAPEQAAGRALDQRADVFAMGVVLWEALTRRRLFAAEDSAEVFRRVLYQTIAPPSSVHPSLAPFDAVLARALARNPEERFDSAHEFARALERTALASFGLAEHDVVAKLVSRLAHDKLTAERARMTSAAELLERCAVDERSETRRLDRTDGIGRDPAALAVAPGMQPGTWRRALRDMGVARWAGVAAALLIGALATGLFPTSQTHVAKTARSQRPAVRNTSVAHTTPTAVPAAPVAPVAAEAPVVAPAPRATTGVRPRPRKHALPAHDAALTAPSNPYRTGSAP